MGHCSNSDHSCWHHFLSFRYRPKTYDDAEWTIQS
uniref:BLTX234 n=1 Tax=Nephila pilipes TaxID=299642 RepID=A0A076KZQ7_NEPPI|nr:BLTX234 [Nephila pilipes]